MAPPSPIPGDGVLDSSTSASFGSIPIRRLEDQVALFERGNPVAAYNSLKSKDNPKVVTLSHILPFGLSPTYDQLLETNPQYEDRVGFSSTNPRLALAMEFTKGKVSDLYLAHVLLQEFTNNHDSPGIKSARSMWNARRHFTQQAHEFAADHLAPDAAPYVSLGRNPRVFPTYARGAHLSWFGAPAFHNRDAATVVHRIALYTLAQHVAGQPSFTPAVMHKFCNDITTQLHVKPTKRVRDYLMHEDDARAIA